MSSANTDVCSVCGERTAPYTSSTDYLSGETFDVFVCVSCGLGRTLPPVPAHDLARYYATGYYKKRKSGADAYINRARFMNVTRAIQGRNRLLDVGCGNGALVEKCIEAGWDAQGVEMAPPEHFVSDAVQKKIFIGDVRTAPFLPHSFEVITLFHVLEHLPEPRAYLEKIRELVTDDGLLVVEVPNLASLQARLTHGNWFNLDVPRHVFHFTPRSLTHILTQSGFRIERVSHYSPIYSFFGCLQSLLNGVTRRNNILFDVLNGKMTLGASVRHGALFFDILLTAFFLLPALVLALPLTVYESLVKRGGIIVVFARPTSL